jgi:hypothetical protein
MCIFEDLCSIGLPAERRAFGVISWRYLNCIWLTVVHNLGPAFDVQLTLLFRHLPPFPRLIILSCFVFFMHGGNAGLIGWQLIGYPGPQMSYRNQLGKYNGTAYRPKPQSLEQILRRPVKPWEDEERG